MTESLRDKVLSSIKNGKVRMRPRWHFILKTALAISGGIILTLALLYLVSFIFFVLRVNGVWFVPVFGFYGVRTFFVSLPWLLIITSLIFILILETLVRHYSFAYRQPLLYSILGILILVIIGGFVVAQAPFHKKLMIRAQENRLPVTGPFYREFGMHRFRDIHPGIIASTTDDGFILRTRHGEMLTIMMASETRLPFGYNFIEGDGVVVFGERDDDSVKARGIVEVTNEMYHTPFLKRGNPPMMRPSFPPF
ncbi:MAG: hypothetical protein AB1352_01205 [Patescibacteria group bacterium]